MDRYSFFISIAVFGCNSFQSDFFGTSFFVGNSVVYADEFSNIDSYNSVVDSSNDFIDSSSEVYVEEPEKPITYEDIEESQTDENSEEHVIVKRAFPSHNWGFNYQNDPKTIPGTSFPSFMIWFPAYIRNQNDFIDHVAGRINTQQASIHALDIFKANGMAQMNGHGSRLNALETFKANAGAQMNNNGARISSLEVWKGAVISNLDDLFLFKRNAAAQMNGHGDKIAVLQTFHKNALAQLNSHGSRLTALEGFQGNAMAQMNGHGDKIKNLEIWKTAVVSNLDDLFLFKRNATAQMDGHGDKINKLEVWKGAVVSNLDELFKFKKDATAELNNKTVAIAGNSLRITALENKINSLDIDGVIKAINDMSKLTNANILLNTHATDVVRDSVNTLKDSFENGIYAESSAIEGGINSKDGDLTKMIKGQFTRLIAESYKQNADLWNSNGKVEENASDGSFVKLLKNLVYSIRYSLIAEFSDFTKVFKDEMKASRDNFNKYIELVNQNLVTGIGWLKLIYDKKIIVDIPPISVLPSDPFILDYDRLQKMFDGIDFGSITNEAGKNIWDFLSELVKAIADLAVAVLGLVEALADKIIKLFVPENFDFIDEGFEQLSDSFDKKFKFAIDIGSDILKIFNVPQVKFSDKSIKVAAFDMDMEIPLQFSLINDFAVYVRGLITAFILIYNLKYIYGRIVGEGDII